MKRGQHLSADVLRQLKAVQKNVSYICVPPIYQTAVQVQDKFPYFSVHNMLFRTITELKRHHNQFYEEMELWRNLN